MIWILLAALVSFALLLLANRAYFASELALRDLPLRQRRAKSCASDSKDIFLRLGLGLRLFFANSRILQNIESEYLYLGYQQDSIYRSLGQVLMVFGALLLVYVMNHQIYFLLFAFLLPAFLLLELKRAASDYHRDLEANSLHLCLCVRALLINTETPLEQALQIIINTWPSKGSATVRELEKILSKIDKMGPREALSNWEAGSQRFRDFLSFLLSASEGASKRALSLSLAKLIKESEREDRSKLEDEAENLQLYLVGPVVLILLLSMYPMAAAINFMMQNSFLKGEIL